MSYSKLKEILNPTTEYIEEYPEIYTTLHLFCIELDLDTYGFGTDSTVYELESKRRDGFIPSAHNRGGFDVLNYLHTESDGDDGEGYLVLHGFRFMYEGEKDGIHTLCGYYSQWSEYDVYGMHKAATLADVEIRFRNTEELIVELDKFTNRAME